MTLYYILLAVQIFAIFFGIFGLVTLFSSMLRPEAKFLLGASICTIIFGVGYCMEMVARSLEAAFLSLCVEYLGLAYIGLFFAIYIEKISGAKKIPRIIWYLIVVYETITLLLHFSSRYHTVFYKSISYVNSGIYPHLEQEMTPWFHLFMVHIAVLVLYGAVNIVRAARRAPSKIRRTQLTRGCIIALFPLLAMVYSAVAGFSGYEPVSAVTLIAVGFFSIVRTAGKTTDPVELAYSESFSKAIAGIIILDSEHRYLDANDKARKIFPELDEYNTGEIFKKWDIFMDACRMNKRLRLYGRYYSTYFYELLADGKSIGFVLGAADVTIMENQVRELERLKVMAEEASEAKTTFLANMSHEMRTPLNAIIGLSELAQREDSLPMIKEYLPMILNSGQMLLDIISDVLDFSKAEAGKVDIVPVQYDIKEVLSTAINMANIRIGEKNIDFIVDVDPKLPRNLIGDDARIRQIIVNFLTNAVKYTDRGFIRFSVDREDKGDNKVDLIIKVTDSGRGIREEDIDKLFTNFSRVDIKNNRNIQGTGLGLAICGRLIKLMNGDYTVESNYGKGSVFTCTIPQEAVGDATISAHQREELHVERNTPFVFDRMDIVGEDGQNKAESEDDILKRCDVLRMLIVDDNVINIKVLTSMLKLHNIVPDSVTSGKDAVEKLEKQQYDVIFMDHMMPEMDGIEATERIRKLDVPWANDVIIIACTANAIKGMDVVFKESGMDEYICKPIKVEALNKMLIKCLELKGLKELKD